MDYSDEDEEDIYFDYNFSVSKKESDVSIQVQLFIESVIKKTNLIPVQSRENICRNLAATALEVNQQIEFFQVCYDDKSVPIKVTPKVLKETRRKTRAFFCLYISINKNIEVIDPYYLSNALDLNKNMVKNAFKQNPFSVFIEPEDFIPFFIKDNKIDYIPFSDARLDEIEERMAEKNQSFYESFVEMCIETVNFLKKGEIGRDYCDNQCCKNVVLGIICYNAFYPGRMKRKLIKEYADICMINISSLYKAYDDCRKCHERIRDERTEKLKYDSFWWLDT